MFVFMSCVVSLVIRAARVADAGAGVACALMKGREVE